MKRKEFIDKYSKKQYLGDGLYVYFDGFHFILSTQRENGCHWVSLDPPVFDALIRHRKQLYIEVENIDKENEKDE